ncbi:MAG: VCBS repeat-containing protein, partial [Saprospiraceae bacterium]|nr:VCBS repeat-containing protein [Saprospiraceae bacterium]
MRLLHLSLLIVLLTNCERSPKTFFEDLPYSKTRITFKNRLEESEQFNVLNYGYFYNGGGVAAGDINNDGLTDIYFTGNLVASHLYLNEGEWKFKNIAKEAGVEAAG